MKKNKHKGKPAVGSRRATSKSVGPHLACAPNPGRQKKARSSGGPATPATASAKKKSPPSLPPTLKLRRAKKKKFYMTQFAILAEKKSRFPSGRTDKGRHFAKTASRIIKELWPRQKIRKQEVRIRKKTLKFQVENINRKMQATDRKK